MTTPNLSGARPLLVSRVVAGAIAGLSVAFFVPIAPALEFECSQFGDTRFLGVDIPGEDHLCEVSVTGEGGAGERRVLWYAENDTLFCSAKAYELRDKYVDEFSFDCHRWPDSDGIDLLSARQRAILDAELKSLLADTGTDGDTVSLSGVRAVASTPFDGEEAMLALQFLAPGGGDHVRIVIDSTDGTSVIAELRDLAGRVDPVPDLRTRGAFIESISPSGALEVVTLLEPEGGSGSGPEEREVDTDRAMVCEGRQTFHPRAGDLVAGTPHRHACTVDPVAFDPG